MNKVHRTKGNKTDSSFSKDWNISKTWKSLRIEPRVLQPTSIPSTKNLAKLKYFTNLGFPEIRGFPLLSQCEVAIIWPEKMETSVPHLWKAPGKCLTKGSWIDPGISFRDRFTPRNADATYRFCPKRLTSWWFFTNPFEKYVRQIGSFPQVGMKINIIPPGKDRWLATPISLGLSWPLTKNPPFGSGNSHLLSLWCNMVHLKMDGFFNFGNSYFQGAYFQVNHEQNFGRA